jgi:hypothetical protein
MAVCLVIFNTTHLPTVADEALYQGGLGDGGVPGVVLVNAQLARHLLDHTRPIPGCDDGRDALSLERVNYLARLRPEVRSILSGIVRY